MRFQVKPHQAFFPFVLGGTGRPRLPSRRKTEFSCPAGAVQGLRTPPAPSIPFRGDAMSHPSSSGIGVMNWSGLRSGFSRPDEATFVRDYEDLTTATRCRLPLTSDEDGEHVTVRLDVYEGQSPAWKMRLTLSDLLAFIAAAATSQLR